MQFRFNGLQEGRIVGPSTAGTLGRMNARRLLLPGLLAASLAMSAQAAQLGFGVSYSPQAVPTSTARLGITDLNLAGTTLSLYGSTRAAELALRRNLPLTALGTARLGLDLAGVYTGQPGVRLGLTAGGTLGPVALTASGNFWTTPVAALDPLAVWNQDTTDTSPRGAQGQLQARYRLARPLIVQLDAELGRQSNAALVAEYRASEALSLRLGGRAGAGVLGAQAGVSYRAEAFTLTADALFGRERGAALSLDAPALWQIGERPVGLNAYLKYEPWRTTAPTLRYGMDISLPLLAARAGELSVGVRGGTGGYGVRAGYTFSLGTTP